MQVGEVWFDVVIAESDEEKRIGLSKLTALREDAGMLFVNFDPNFIPIFWMKEMLFPIDILWIYQDKVIGMFQNVFPEERHKENELRAYSPPKPVNWVLEINAGQAKRKNIKVGDAVKLIF